MTDKQDKTPSTEKGTPRSHILLWSLVTVFIVLAIFLMWAADYYFSPEMLNAARLPEAVGK